MNRDERASVVRAAQNKIADNGLNEFYGKPLASEVVAAYPEDRELADAMIELATYLESTQYPKYVRLGMFLKEMSETINVEYQQAKVMLSKKENQNKYLKDRNVKTIVSEFNKIKRRAKKLNKTQAMKLNKYRDVKKFITEDLEFALMTIKGEHFNLKQVEDRKKLCTLLESMEVFNFLNTSRLTRKVR